MAKTKKKRKKKVAKVKEVITLTRAKYSLDQLEAIFVELLNTPVFILDLETTGLNPRQDKIIGIGLGTLKKEWYLFVDEIDKNLLQTLLNCDKKTMVGQNLIFDVDFLGNTGYTVKNKLWDTKAAAFLINENRSLHLKDMGKELFDMEVTKYKAVDWDNPNMVEKYGKQDIIITRKVYQKYIREIDTNYPIFYKLYMPLIRTIIEVQNNGIKVNLDYLDVIFWELKDEVDDLKSQLDTEIRKITHCEEINEKMHNSPKQLRELFFGKLGLEPVHISRKTKQPSTDERTLRVLAMRGSALANVLLRYRGKNKLFTTYVQPIIERTDKETGRLHTTYNPYGAVTGRWNSSKPNLQNIPMKDKGLIRQAFVAEPNNVLLIADYSQIELRLLAHFSKDTLFNLSYTKGLDLHKKTASAIFHKSESMITDDERAIGKTVNFSVIYGISPFALAENLGIKMWDAKKYIDTYFNTYKGVTAFKKNTVERCKVTGYVETLFYRKRRLPDVSTKRTERQAVNSIIQGSAADILNRAINQLYEKFKGTDLRLLLQVHDEIVLECPKDKADYYMLEIKKIMEHAVKLTVPLKCNVKACFNWSQK